VTSDEQTTAAYRRGSASQHKAATQCNLMQHVRQERCNPTAATVGCPNHRAETSSEDSPPTPAGNTKNGVDSMKTNEILEIGFVREKSVVPHLPGPADPSQTYQPKLNPPHANSFNINV
jgi:hypothetical protein